MLYMRLCSLAEKGVGEENQSQRQMLYNAYNLELSICLPCV